MDNKPAMKAVSANNIEGATNTIVSSGGSLGDIISELNHMMGFELSQAELMLMRPDLFASVEPAKSAQNPIVTSIKSNGPKEVVSQEQVTLPFPTQPVSPAR